jgi:hypothetical protein
VAAGSPEDVSAVWSFPPASVGHDDSVKGYEVDATDGVAGTVSWASYRPGESYLVVSHRHRLHDTHFVIPAGAVRHVRHDERKVVLGISIAEAHSNPQVDDPAAPLDPAIVAAFAHGAPGAPEGGLIV